MVIKHHIKKIIDKYTYLYKLGLTISQMREKLNFNELVKVTKHSKFENRRVLLPLIETSHYKFIQLLLIAKSLQLRGAEVYVLVCDQALSICEIRSVQRSDSDVCWNCKINRKKLLPIFGLKTISLSDYINDISDSKAISLIGLIENEFPSFHLCVEDSVIRHYYGNIETDKQRVDQVRLKHQITAIKTWVAASLIYNTLEINLVLGYMIAYSEFAPFYSLCKKKNVPFKIISSTQFDGKAQIFNWPDLYHSDGRFIKYIKTRDGRKLDQNENQLLLDFINKRKNGNDPVLNELGIAKKKDNTLSQFGIEIDKNKKNIFLFSNVFWDIGMSDLNNIFTSITEWVFHSVRLLANKENCHLYIRCHPAEKLSYVNGQKGVMDLILREFPNLPSNVTIISSENKVSSYDLYPYIDLGLIYNGTIGLEMLLEGIPIVAAGKAPYSFLKSVLNPSTIKEFDTFVLSERHENIIDIDEVKLFAYFYFIKTSIPWTLTEKAYPANLLAPFEFDSIENLMPGGNVFLDHICECLVDEELSPENWK